MKTLKKITMTEIMVGAAIVLWAVGIVFFLMNS